MKPRTPLQQAAFCALADLSYLWETDSSIFISPMTRTYMELHDALKEEGHDVSEYTELYETFFGEIG